MQGEKSSSCQVPLALAICLLVAATVFCFVGAIALGIGIYYLIEASHKGHVVVVVTPTPFATPRPFATSTPKTRSTPVSPRASPTVSFTPFPSVTPFTPSTPFRSTTPNKPPASSSPSAELDQYGFRTAQIQIGNETLDVELAETPQELAKGLRFRETLAKDAGMLFIFGKPQRLSFWMKDASIPLSIAYIQPDGKIVQIRKMQPYDETPVPSLSDAVSYALLVNQGWFERHGIAAGTVIGDLPH
jgi:uncharacterized membrane protein (UPF0127 family)